MRLCTIALSQLRSAKVIGCLVVVVALLLELQPAITGTMNASMTINDTTWIHRFLRCVMDSPSFCICHPLVGARFTPGGWTFPPERLPVRMVRITHQRMMEMKAAGSKSVSAGDLMAPSEGAGVSGKTTLVG